ncbi:PHD Zn-finger protein [Thermoascus aurantiacus ATCC 26904]
MTDTSSVATTQPTTEPYPVTAPLNSPAPNGAVSDTIPPEDDEPYTIKCICAFEDDDGNTVFCEGCETWQHIECYYHGQEVPEVHNCVDCEPRPLDGKRATERQRRLREQLSDGGDRKSKRSGTKSQKKKAKDHHDQVNGYHHRSESSPRDQPPAKKPKTSHKPSTSVSSFSGAPALQPESRKRSGSTTSPTKSSGPFIPLYSSEFLHLYERDRKHVHMESNLFVNLTLAADLASWVKDPAALARVVNGRSPQDVFTRSDASLDPSTWPSLTLHSFTDTSVEVDGKHPTFKTLRTEEAIRKDTIVGEVKGKIGLLRDYCLDPNNRWQELRHPEPFVFFHPLLPIYIDSRDEGTILRYIRRSCHPNVTMKTYITNEVEYHFCFVATQDIPIHSEITAMWYLDQQLVGSANGLMKPESSDGIQEAAAICLSNVLANFGGCACDLGSKCLLFRFDRRSIPKATDSSTKQLNGKRKKAKSSKQTTSPPGTGQATNSRAGSEGVKNQDDDDQADSRSTSGSARGQARSRDLTPTQRTPSDLGDSELSARDKRKIAAVEKKFEQLEQDQQSLQRKKKRSGGQSAQTTPTVASSKQAGYFANHGIQSKSLHWDTGTEHQSRSPPSHLSPSSPQKASPRKTSESNTPAVRSPLGRPQYVDSAIQTDPDENDVRYVPPTPPPPRRQSFVPLTQRLLKRCHEDRVKFEEMCRQRDALASSASGGSRPSSSSAASSDGTAGKPAANEINDVEMKDVDPSQSGSSGAGGPVVSSESHSLSPGTPDGVTKPPPPHPWPSTAAHNSIIPGQAPNGIHSDLDRPDAKNSTVQPPPTPMRPLPVPSTPGLATPSGFESSLSQPGIQTPGSGVAAPSPVKKKLSLGDYLSRRGTLTTPTSEKTQAQVTAMPPPHKAPASQSQAGSSPTLSAKGAETQTPATATANAEKRESPSTPDVRMKDVAEPPLSSPSVSSISPLSRQPKIQPPSR